MATDLFNSTFEMGLRILCLLSSDKKNKMTLDRIVSLDFITCYAECFQFPYENLHGDNDYMYGELSNRRALSESAIKTLVKQGFISVSIEKGYTYCITNIGKMYTKKLESDYASNYKTIALDVIQTFRKTADNDLINIIQDNAIRSLKGAR